MLRKFSTKFKRRREEVNGVNGVNGINGTPNGVTNGTNGESTTKPALSNRHSSFAPFKSKKETSKHSTDHNASRADVESLFEQFAQVLHASVRNQICFFFFISTATESQGIFRKPLEFCCIKSCPEEKKLTSKPCAAATLAHSDWRRVVLGSCPIIWLNGRHQGYGFQGCTHLNRCYEEQGNRGPSGRQNLFDGAHNPSNPVGLCKLVASLTCF